MKKDILAFGTILVAAILIMLALRKPVPKAPLQVANKQTNAPAMSVSALTNSVSTNRLIKISTRLNELSDADKENFRSNFVARYKPALKRWSDAFDGRVPFSPDSVTADNMVERIGKNATYSEYVFAVDGITLGIQDSKGVAVVDYLNSPKETGKMTVLPKNPQPVSTLPITRDELLTMLTSEGSVPVVSSDIRIVPSGFSGSLNGGAIVNVGGAPDNPASWKYDLVFGTDGKLAYYLKPNH